MINKISGDVVTLFEQRGVMGVVQEVLSNSATMRTKNNFERIKKEILCSFSSGMIRRDSLQKYLQQVLYEKETVLVLFKKNKKNERMRGDKQIFKQGFSDYIGLDDDNLAKVYMHWEKEKKFLLENIGGLKNELFWIEMRNIDISNVFWINLHLFNGAEKTILDAEISLYIGYQECKE